jgi:tetratricopeptide (TPR) repeat protein
MLAARPKLRPFVLFALFAFTLVSGASLSGQQAPTSNVIGVLQLERGSFPSERVEVKLESSGILVGQTFSDDEGRFAFNQVLGGVYHLVIDDPNYLPVEQTLQFDPSFPMNMVLNIYLQPRKGSNNGESRVNDGAGSRLQTGGGQAADKTDSKRGVNPYTVSVADYNRHFPHDAVKEFEKGAEALRKNKLDDARKHYEKALNIAPNFYPARNDLGTVYLQKRDFQGAQDQFQQVIKENPNDPDAYFNLANVRLLIEDYDGGLNLVSQGLAKLPNAPQGLFIEGSLYRHLGKYPEAERCLRDAIKADPTLANAHLELANLYRQEDDRRDLTAELQTFLKLYPNNPLCPQVKNALQKLSSARPVN